MHAAGDSIFTQSAPVKRQQTAAERKAERRAKLAELADVDPDQPWALQVTPHILSCQWATLMWQPCEMASLLHCVSVQAVWQTAKRMQACPMGSHPEQGRRDGCGRPCADTDQIALGGQPCCALMLRLLDECR